MNWSKNNTCLVANAHILLCWLALLMIRVAETATGRTWHQLPQAFSLLTVGIYGTRESEIWQTNPLTAEQKDCLSTLKLKLPPRYLSISLSRLA